MVAGTASLFSLLFFVLMSASGEHKIIKVKSGEDVTLTCRAPNNNISVEWSRADLGDENVLLYQDGHFVPDNQHPSFKNRVDLQDKQMKDGDVSLILKDVTINDAGTYQCHVYMEETASWKLINISLIVVVVVPDQKTITAESGQDVTLTCRAPNNNIIVVKWSRADLGDEHVLVYRDDQVTPDDQHQSFKNRVDLQDRQMKDGDVSLILKNVTINDAGTYGCRAVMQEIFSWWLIRTVYLHVVPPDQKNITAESGQNVTLTCRAPNNKFIGVEWSRADLGDEYLLLYRNEQYVPYYQHPSFKNRVDLQDRQMKDGDVSLILKDVAIKDAGTYECRVYMAETDSWQLISVISLRVVPPDQKNITAEPGQDVTLTCRASNNIRVARWSRADLEYKNVLLYGDNRFFPANQHPSFKNRVDLQDRQMKDGDVSLILKDVTINDTGTYECRVYMEQILSWKIISIIHLSVVDPPDQEIITAESGQDVTLTCRAPNKKIIVLRWSRADLEPKYVLSYWNGHFDPDDQHPSFKNRVDLQDRQMKDGDVSSNSNSNSNFICHIHSHTQYDMQ